MVTLSASGMLLTTLRLPAHDSNSPKTTWVKIVRRRVTVMVGEMGRLVGGRYRLAALIGQGGMGRVWRGVDETLNRQVAVKEVLLPDGLPPGDRAQLVRRTLREAEVAAKLGHPGIITVHDVVRDADVPWIVMEYVSGPSLAGLVAQDGRLPWKRVAAIGAQMADALAHAHGAGVVHRDLKPDNVLVQDRRTIITDFGIARVLDGSAGTRLTRTGAVVGTPQYMPPEQIEGGEAAASGDLWSLGATLYAAVEGNVPFDAPSLMPLFHAILTKPLPAPRHAGELGPVLEELLAKDPGKRPTAAALAVRLTALHHPPTQRGQQPPAPPRQIHHLSTVTAPAQPPNAVHPPTRPATSARRRPSTAATPTPAVPSGPRRRTLLFAGATVAIGATGGWWAWTSDTKDDAIRADTSLPGHTKGVYALAYSPNGKSLASASEDNTVRLWNVTAPDGDVEPAKLTGLFWALAFSPDGRTLAGGGADGTIHLWNAADRSLVGTLEGHKQQVSSLAFSPDGRTLASGGLDASIRLWSPADRKLLERLDGHDSNVAAVAFSPDGRTLASGSWDNSVRLWSVAGRKTVARFSHANYVSSVAFGPDGGTLASGCWDNSVSLWSVTGREKAATLDGHTSVVRAVAFSPDGKALASAAEDETVRLWNPNDGTEIAVLSEHAGALCAVAFSPDGRRVASADDSVRLWDLDRQLPAS
ncbi:WD40 repeat domain-containing serine/threonine protein kinase [Streptomyces antibioticus]|uniref:Protein kinase n=2 Tax=Streptomyces antibioticus TaxID=1890 RepID=A0AAE6YEF2_STRAT|nr:serine/threonine-protein kinase [Streptomyces antibioticus]QIT48423.1 protein kinase [Streptomyces antibioticus]